MKEGDARDRRLMIVMTSSFTRWCLLAAMCATGACAPRDEVRTEKASGNTRSEPIRLKPEATDKSEATKERDSVARPRIVALGDSLTAGLGLAPPPAYPARHQ